MKLATSVLVFSVAALLALGLVMLYSSNMAENGAHLMFKQSAWAGLGLMACAGAAILDYRWLNKFALLILAAAMLFLALVLVPGIGVVAGGARRWFSVGGFSCQPSEFAKVALIIALAWYGARYQRQMGTFWRGIVIPGAMSGAVLGLIFFEPDVGATLLLGAVCAVMLCLAGTRWRYLLPPVILGIVAVGLFIWLDPMRSDRIYSWLHLEETRLGKGLQGYQAMIALGAGGLDGLGLGNSRQKLGFIPEHHTDFILSVIGEELGLIATMGIVVAFVLVILSGIYIAMHARDTFGMLMASGITFLIGLQAFINIGVVTSALPNKGLPLPFISYGGSNLVMMLIGVGLLLSVARRAHAPQAAPDHAFAPEELSSPQLI